jgi:hypothetical protein
MHEELNELGNAMSLMEKIMTSLISDRPRLAVFPLHTIRSGNGAPRIQGLRDDGAPAMKVTAQYGLLRMTAEPGTTDISALGQLMLEVATLSDTVQAALEGVDSDMPDAEVRQRIRQLIDAYLEAEARMAVHLTHLVAQLCDEETGLYQPVSQMASNAQVAPASLWEAAVKLAPSDSLVSRAMAPALMQFATAFQELCAWGMEATTFTGRVRRLSEVSENLKTGMTALRQAMSEKRSA